VHSKKFKALIQDHEVWTVPEKGWAGVKNGKLPALIQSEFDVFVTVGRNLAFQQNMKDLKIIVMVLHSASNRFEELKKLAPELMQKLNTARAGDVVSVGVRASFISFSVGRPKTLILSIPLHTISLCESIS
jgi:hypothetical protein